MRRFWLPLLLLLTTGALAADNDLVCFDAAGRSKVCGAVNWPDGVRQTFNPDATNAGLNVGGLAGDPSSPSNGDLWYDSTANELTARINGSNVALGGGGGTPGGATTNVQFNNGGAFDGDAEFTWNTTNKRLDLTGLTAAADGTDPMVFASGTLPSSPTNGIIAMEFNIATATGTFSQIQTLAEFDLEANYTGSSATKAVSALNRVAGTGVASEFITTTFPSVNFGANTLALGATAGTNYGFFGDAQNSSNLNMGVVGRATDDAVGANVGVFGSAGNSTNSSLFDNFAGFFTLRSSLPTDANVSAALGADNGSGTNSIARFYDNGTLAWLFDDGGFARSVGFTHANLGTPANGTHGFCTDCTKATPCGSGGNGAWAVRINGAWDCNV